MSMTGGGTPGAAWLTRRHARALWRPQTQTLFVLPGFKTPNLLKF
jgi:hypothetical protein